MDEDFVVSKKLKPVMEKNASLTKENALLKEKVENMTRYVEELENFLKDEAELSGSAAADDPITQIRTYSRGKESAFQYVLDILRKLKPEEEQQSVPDDGQDAYYEKEIKLGNTISFFYSPAGSVTSTLKMIFKERATHDAESIIEMLRLYMKQIPKELNCSINMTFVP
ncbi:MAG: hypothetical protein GY757_15585 [bacterium]|nr:hypothetical protein [bacterium]